MERDSGNIGSANYIYHFYISYLSYLQIYSILYLIIIVHKSSQCSWCDDVMSDVISSNLNYL